MSIVTQQKSRIAIKNRTIEYWDTDRETQRLSRSLEKTGEVNYNRGIKLKVFRTILELNTIKSVLGTKRFEL